MRNSRKARPVLASVLVVSLTLIFGACEMGPPCFFCRPLTDQDFANATVKCGEDVVPIVGDLGGPVDEIMSRYGKGLFPSSFGSTVAPAKYLLMLNNSTRIFATDENSAWGSVDLGRYFPSGGSIYAIALVGKQIVLGTDQGIAWVNALDGTYGHFSGAPTNFVVSLVANGTGGVLAGIYYGSSSGAPSIYRCDVSSHTCSLSNSGMTADQNGSAIADFAVVPGTSGSTIFAGALYGNGVFKTTDGGANWTPCDSGVPQKASIRRVFAAGGNVFLGSDATYSSSSAGVYVSTNMGGSWTKASGLPAGPVFGIGGDASAVYAGVNAPSVQAAAVYKSTNGGNSWQPTGPGLTASTINGIAVGNLGVYAATKGGTFRSTDGGGTWATFNEGKDNATVLSVLSANGTLYVGTQGNLSGVQRSTDGGLSWTPGDAAIANKVIGSLAAAGTTIVGSGSSGTFRSTDGGATWTASSPRVFASVVSSGGTFFGANATFGSGVVAVYKSPDGVTWSPSNAGMPANTGATALTAAGGTLYAGIGPAVYSSTNGGSSWNAGGKVWAADTTYQISCLQVVDNVLYAGLTGFGAAPETYGFYKSLDGGNTWTSIRSGLPSNSYAYAIAGIGSTLFAGMQGGLFQSTDGGSSWTVITAWLNGVPINALATTGSTLWVGTSGRDIRGYQVPISVTRLVPVVLDVDNGPTAHYTTELSLTNRGTTAVAVTMTYTASVGSGSGTATENLSAGQQLVIGDVIAHLREKRLSIPASGAQVGTLRLTFDGLSAPDVVAAMARTTTPTGAPQPVGRAGLAYAALGPADVAPGRLTVYGLRSNGTDRSKATVFSMSSAPVTVRVTAFSGNGDGRSFVAAAGDVLPPWGWKQYDGMLEAAGFDNAWVTVEQTSTTGAFSAYGVVNDNATQDGSYLLPSFPNTMLDYINIPVVVETSAVLSELVLANSGATAATITLGYSESLTPPFGTGGTMTLTLPPATQQIIPNVIAFLRQNRIPVGPPGGKYAGSLHVGVSGAHLRDVYAGARTASLSPVSGQFGVFTPGFFPGSEGVGEAYLYGLRADATNRSNVTVVNTAASSYGGSITVQLQAYDGDAGGVPKGSPLAITLAPGQWDQESGFLGAKGVANGWVKVTRTSGSSPWIAYGVVNDGGAPGQRSGDGAYVPMVR